MFCCLRDAGLHTVATLHHFVHPKWFQDLGGFLKEENLTLFKQFCCQMEEEFREYVHMWVTFNEPAVVCLTGHVFGIFPPGKHPIRVFPPPGGDRDYALIISVWPDRVTPMLRSCIFTLYHHSMLIACPSSRGKVAV